MTGRDDCGDGVDLDGLDRCDLQEDARLMRVMAVCVRRSPCLRASVATPQLLV